MRRRAAGVAGALALAMLVIGQALPARATTPSDGILLSTDGVHFARTPSGPLFDPAARIVPGGKETVSLYVRNDSGHPALVAVHATAIHFSSMQLAELIELHASTPGTTGTAAATLAAGQCIPLISDVSVPAGTTTPISLNLAMSAGAQGSQGQRQSVAFDVLVSARDRTEPAPASSSCTAGTTIPGFSDSTSAGSDPSSLPDTGSDILLPIAVVSMLAGAGSALIVAARRRRRKDQQEEPS